MTKPHFVRKIDPHGGAYIQRVENGYIVEYLEEVEVPRENSPFFGGPFGDLSADPVMDKIREQQGERPGPPPMRETVARTFVFTSLEDALRKLQEFLEGPQAEGVFPQKEG